MTEKNNTHTHIHTHIHTRTHARTHAHTHKREIYSRKLPYTDIPKMATILRKVQEGFRPEIPPDCPAKFAALMEVCWHQDPVVRPAMPDVVRRLQALLKQESRTSMA